MQKLVTIYLDSWAYKKKVGSKQPEWHGQIEEHLQQYLEDGWTINSVTGFGGSESIYVRGWIIALLEKN